METYGKKQINIREDNKSAVIDILLKQESTMLQISEKLRLSHTALAKVIKELTQKNVVRFIDVCEASSGRPPKVYGINEDCAIACAVVATARSVLVYYFDMRGFQINETSRENDFESLEALLRYTTEQIELLKLHPRLKEKILKYIYVGIPSVDFFGKAFSENRPLIFSAFCDRFPSVCTVVKRNVDYEMIAENKYGLLRNGEKNAALVNFDFCADVSLLFGGEIYAADRYMQGVWDRGRFGGLRELEAEFTKDGAGREFFAAYREGDPSATEIVSEKMTPVLGDFDKVFAFLGITEIVVSGDAKGLGGRFLEFAEQRLKGCRIRYSLEWDVPAALSGAVWLSTYSTLQDVMAR